MPSRPPSPSGATGTTCGSISESGCTVVVRRRRPGASLQDRTGRKSLLRAVAQVVLAWWRSGRLALAVDLTLKGDGTTAIVISVVYRGCAIPVAWRILRANKRGAWKDPIVELLQALAPAVPRETTVVALCDRGLASPKLWKQILAQSLPRRRPGAGIPA